MKLVTRLKPRLRSAVIHFGISATIAAAAALLIFNTWYPAPFSGMAGAFTLFALLVGVDVALGPALTAVVASPGKPRRVLVRDLAVIVVVQLAAFGYGIHTMAIARPVALVFEVNQLRLVSAVDIEKEELEKAPANLRRLSWRGPRLMAAAKPIDGDEQFRSIELALAGIHLAMQPVYWRDIESQRAGMWNAAKPVAKLLARYPDSAEEVRRSAVRAGVRVETLRFLPVTSRQADWVALIAGPDARIIGYLHFDGFF